MFDDWKDAWREAVENFRRELGEAEEGGGDAPSHVRAMRRELSTVRGALQRLDTEIARARDGARSERESQRVCERREELARRIGDEETVRVAAGYATRHAKRAAVLERKVAVLTEERELLAADVATMEEAVDAQPDLEPGVRSAILDALQDQDERREQDDRRFRAMEREARAVERLEELKRKHR